MVVEPLVPEPEASPEYPVQTYRVPVPPLTGEVTENDADDPELYHPAPVGEP
jgi:hypothetical protein